MTKRNQERCLLPAGESGPIWDRVLLVEQVIGSQHLRPALQDTGCFDRRRCRRSREVIFWIVLARGILTDLPLRQVFTYARRLRPAEATPHRSSLCLARQRLGGAPRRRWFERVVGPLATPQTADAFSKGWRRMALDGTVYNVPDSPAHAAAWGRAWGGHRGDGAFPQVRQLRRVEVGTHLEGAFVAKGIQTPNRGEQRWAAGLFRHRRPDRLLRWDRGFFRSSLGKQVGTPGCPLLTRLRRRWVLRPMPALADGS